MTDDRDPTLLAAPVAPPRRWVPLLALAGPLLLTAVAAYQVERAARTAARVQYQATLDEAAIEVRDRIAGRREAFVAILHGTAGLFAGDRYVPPSVFSEYVRGLKLEQTYPGVMGIGVITRTPAAERDKVEANLASLGVDPPRVWPEDPPRDEYYPIIYVEPLDAANRVALGFDASTDPTGRAALERARDEASAAASAKLRLGREADGGARRPGFAMYYPIYRSREAPTPTTVEQRREQVVAFVYGPFRADAFLTGALAGAQRPWLQLDVYDGVEQSPEHRLNHAPDTRPAAHYPVGPPLTVDMGGRTWTLVFHTDRPPPGGGALSATSVAVLSCGGAISVLLFALTRAQGRARAAAEADLAHRRASDARIRASEEQLRVALASQTEARSQAEALAAEADAANRMKDEFLATLSHELRTPLNAILGWSQLLRMPGLEDGEAEQGLETIERSARAQAHLVDDLLDVSRIISGKLRLEVRPVDLPSVVENALDSLRPAAEAKGISVAPVIDAHAGPVNGDAHRLQQVAWNLLSNAIKFTPRGGTVQVWLRGTSQDVEMSVSDTGQGIRPDFLPHVFDRLRQADASSTRQHGGLGLGLAIVRHLVELHGGTVTAESPGEGRGATFTVRLPLSGPRPVPGSDGSDETPGRGAAEAPPRRAAGAGVHSGTGTDAGPGAALDGVRVLVVDDEPDARQVLELGLSLRGADVMTAACADEAMRALRSARPDVIVSDIGMPGEDGYSLMRRVRRLPDGEGGRVPALALTAFARAEDRERALSAGFQIHVAKPVEPSQLAGALARLLGREPVRSAGAESHKTAEAPDR